MTAALLFLTGILASGIAVANSCVDCHKNPIFRQHNQKLYTYYQDWLTSPHREAGLTCDQCHGGNPDTDAMEVAHPEAIEPGDSDSKVFYKNQAETCGVCHPQVTEQFTQSKHYQAVMQAAVAPNCSTCHRAMNKKPYYHSIVSETCRSCHWQTNGQGHDITAQAEEVLRRLNIAKGYLGWSDLYFRMMGWPGSSKQDIEQFRSTYHDIIANGHSFDLLDSDKASTELLSNLKEVFNNAWNECHSQKLCERLKLQPEKKPDVR